MDFDLDSEQRELRDNARRFLEREAPIAYARAMMDDARGYRDDVWKQMAELGWLAIALPEEHGGLGLGPIALAILVIEMGRVVLPGPFLPSTLAALAIADAGNDEQRARLLPRLAAGSATGAFAHLGRVDEKDGILSGARSLVPNGDAATVVVTPAHPPDETVGLFVAEPAARTRVSMLDMTQRTADLSFEGARAERLGSSSAADIGRALDRGALLHAAELVGLAERALELAVDHAKERKQFGRPIGSFQAVKHCAADMLVDVESMRNAVYYAAWALERGTPGASLAVSAAKAFASEAGPRVVKSAVQIHGGIGFTWEHDLHLYLKRAMTSAAAYGDATMHRERVAHLVNEQID